MPVCVWCGEKVLALYKVYAGGNIRIARCPHCGKIADKYVEYDFVSKFLDIVLRREEVLKHLLFNSHDYGAVTAKHPSLSPSRHYHHHHLKPSLAPFTPEGATTPTTPDAAGADDDDAQRQPGRTTAVRGLGDGHLADGIRCRGAAAQVEQMGSPSSESPPSTTRGVDKMSSCSVMSVESRGFESGLLKFAAAVVMLDAYTKWKTLTEVVQTQVTLQANSSFPSSSAAASLQRLHATVRSGYLADFLVAFPLVLSIVSMLSFIFSIALVSNVLRKWGICRGLPLVSVGQVAVAILASTDGRFGGILMLIWDPALSLRQIFGMWSLLANYKCLKVLLKGHSAAAFVCVAVSVVLRTIPQLLLCGLCFDSGNNNWHLLWM